MAVRILRLNHEDARFLGVERCGRCEHLASLHIAMGEVEKFCLVCISRARAGLACGHAVR